MMLFIVGMGLAFSGGLMIGVGLMALLNAGKYDDIRNNRID